MINIQFIVNDEGVFIIEVNPRSSRTDVYKRQEYGFTCAKPDGAFYLFVKSPVEDEKEFCEVAKKHHVLVVPGSSTSFPIHM